MSNETIYECAGCGCSFDLSNEHETDTLKKHNEGVYPCETFNWFCENFGSVADCKCSECLELGECDTCGATYNLADRYTRCGDCGECGEHCIHS